MEWTKIRKVFVEGEGKIRCMELKHTKHKHRVSDQGWYFRIQGHFLSEDSWECELVAEYWWPAKRAVVSDLPAYGLKEPLSLCVKCSVRGNPGESVIDRAKQLAETINEYTMVKQPERKK